MGVRRVGKTTLARSLPDADHFDCELPRTRALLAGPESFLAARTGPSSSTKSTSIRQA
jgi:hypothetical protein